MPPTREHLNDAPLRQVPALLANISLGCKGLKGTNALAYLQLWSVTKEKIFMALAPGATVVLAKKLSI
jgi:hypothetical protein